MRKDLRIGLGIGGVLLAVMVVALVVKSHTRQKALVADKTDKSDTDAVPATPESSPLTSTDPGTPTATPATPAPSSPSAPEAATPEKPADPFDTPKTSWDKILLEGSMPTTVTPSGHATDPSIGQHFTSGASSPGLTPGNFPQQPIIAEGARTSPAPAPAPAHGTRTHVIAAGDTLSTIAKSTYGSTKYYLLIEKANPNIVPERLRLGTTINLPDLPASDRAERHASHGSAASATVADSSTQYAVKPNDSLYRISMRLYGSANKVDALYEVNKDVIGPDRGRLKLGMILKLPTPPTSASR